MSNKEEVEKFSADFILLGEDGEEKTLLEDFMLLDEAKKRLLFTGNEDVHNI